MAQLIIYLWVLHGENVATRNIYLPFEFEFKSLIMHTNALTVGNSNELIPLMHEPYKLLLGCPYLPTSNSTGHRVVYLPPLLFNVILGEPEDRKPFFGLFRYNGFQDPMTGAISFTTTRLLSWDDIARITNGEIKAYSFLFKHIKNDCRLNNYALSDIVVSIFSCQVPNPRYSHEYSKIITDLSPTVVPGIPKSDTLLNLVDLNDRKFSFIFIRVGGPPPLSGWKALAGQKEQGCGLNILSYYGIISQTDARERVVCLTQLGTSIFTLLDMIMNTKNIPFIEPTGTGSLAIEEENTDPTVHYTTVASKIFGSLSDENLILRTPIVGGLENIYKYMMFQRSINFAIIFKLYSTSYRDGSTTVLSHVGHTSSLYQYNGQIYLVDPQLSITKLLSDGNFVDEVLSVYKDIFKFIDVIYTQDSDGLIFGSIIKDLIDGGGIILVKDRSKTSHGGRGRYRKSKKSRKSRKCKNCRRRRRISRKHKKNYKLQEGGESSGIIITYKDTNAEILKKYKELSNDTSIRLDDDVREIDYFANSPMVNSTGPATSTP